jgi:Tfp pilus assembly protein FimT
MVDRTMVDRLEADRLIDRCPALRAAAAPSALLAAVLLLALPGRAQGYDPADVASQQQQMQGLIDGALVAIRQNDPVTACNLRVQAVGILNANLQAFQALYPSNNWADLQMSLQDSVNSCQAKGR